VQHRSSAKGKQRERQGHDRVQPAGLQAQTGEQMPPPVAQAEAHCGADQQLHQNFERDPKSRGCSRRQQVLGQHRGEDDGDGIVDAGLDLEGDSNPPLELEPAAAKHRKDRRSIGGRDHRTDEQRLGPAQSQPVRANCHQSRGAGHSHSGEQAGGGGCAADGTQRGIQAAIEEDQGQRQHADAEAELVVVELDPAEPLGAGQHPDHDEQQRDGNSGALRGATEYHAHPQQESAGGEEDRGRVGLVGSHRRG
jgi:hypothetical protein